MNKKIMMSGFSILSALTLLGGTAFAAFTTSATATGNTFSTTNPNLQIQTTAGLSNSEPGFVVGGLVPGSSTPVQNFNLKNADLNTDGTLALTAQFTNPSGTLNANNISVTINCPSSGAVTDTVANWISTPHNLGNLAPNTTQSCTMVATLANGVGNADANKTITFDAVFSGSVGN